MIVKPPTGMVMLNISLTQPQIAEIADRIDKWDLKPGDKVAMTQQGSSNPLKEYVLVWHVDRYSRDMDTECFGVRTNGTCLEQGEEDER